ncbi:hypothetical protein FDF26_14050 [Clostridium botulinum]|nr:hypothetical protein [Clostridium botulinum]
MLFVIIIVIIVFIIINKNANKIIKEDHLKLPQKYAEKGYHFSDKHINVNYIGGIKTVSAKNSMLIGLFKEAISFKYYSEENPKIYGEIFIHFKDIESIEVKTENYIKEQINLGKMLAFGIFSLAMEKNKRLISDEYIVIKVKNNKDCENIILTSNNIQKDINTLLELKESNKN